MIIIIRATTKGNSIVRSFTQKVTVLNCGTDLELVRGLAFKMAFDCEAEQLRTWTGILDPDTDDSGVEDILLEAGVA